jgi:hypothetical protein
MRPEDALAAARTAAGPEEELQGFRVEPADDVTAGQLLDWAVIEPDESKTYSTRRLGAPVTWVKRGLLRALHQYHRELLAEQTRFNLLLTARMQQLEQRVRALEKEREGGSPPS